MKFITSRYSILIRTHVPATHASIMELASMDSHLKSIFVYAQLVHMENSVRKV